MAEFVDLAEAHMGIANCKDRCPDIRGKYTGKLIIAASAACVWDDLEKTGIMHTDTDIVHVMAINDMIMHFPGKLQHAYSNNHQYLPKWKAARRDQYLNRYEFKTLTHSNQVGGDYTWPWPGSGTSSLNAVYTGLALGYKEIELCGVPLDNSHHYFEPPWAKSNFGNLYDKPNEAPRYWRSVAHLFKGRVKSWSGKTRELLGSPDDS